MQETTGVTHMIKFVKPNLVKWNSKFHMAFQLHLGITSDFPHWTSRDKTIGQNGPWGLHLCSSITQELYILFFLSGVHIAWLLNAKYGNKCSLLDLIFLDNVIWCLPALIPSFHGIVSGETHWYPWYQVIFLKAYGSPSILE